MRDKRVSRAAIGTYRTPPPHKARHSKEPNVMSKKNVGKLATPNPNDPLQIFPLLNQHERFMKKLKDLWTAGHLCDVQLSVTELNQEKTTFKAHKVVLAANSDYLREMFVSKDNADAQDVTKIPLLGIKSVVVEEILNAIYSGFLSLSKKTVDDMLSAASFLRMSSVVDACANFLSQRLCVQNCLRTLQVANLYDLSSLLEECYMVASENFGVVSKQREFLKLRYCELQYILPRQDLQVNSELIIFDSIINWVDVDKATRTNYASRLMRHVRFPMIPENEIIDRIEKSAYVSDVPEIGELVREGIRYHLLAHRRSVMQNQRTVPRSTTKKHVLVGCGGLALKKEGQFTDIVYYCDPEDGEWNPLTRLPEPRHHHAVTNLGGFLYVAGGDSTEGTDSPSNKVWRFDPWLEEWLEIAPMNLPRECFQMTELGQKLYVVGGRVQNNVTIDQVESYDPVTNTWLNVQPVSSPRRYIAIASLNRNLYAVGGSSEDLISRRVEKYCCVTKQWERRRALTRPRFSASLHAFQNKLWLIGGATTDPSHPEAGITGANEIEIYFPNTDQWTICKDTSLGTPFKYFEQGDEKWAMPPTTPTGNISDPGKRCYRIRTTRTEHGSCILGDHFFIIGGYSWLNRSRINDVECIETSLLSYSAQKNLDRCKTGEKELDAMCSRGIKHYKVNHYPLRSTGMACSTLTLYKDPMNSMHSKKTISNKDVTSTHSFTIRRRDARKLDQNASTTPPNLIVHEFTPRVFGQENSPIARIGNHVIRERSQFPTPERRSSLSRSVTQSNKEEFLQQWLLSNDNDGQELVNRQRTPLIGNKEHCAPYRKKKNGKTTPY